MSRDAEVARATGNFTDLGEQGDKIDIFFVGDSYPFDKNPEHLVIDRDASVHRRKNASYWEPWEPATDMNAAIELWDEIVDAGCMVELSEDSPNDVHCFVYEPDIWGANELVHIRNATNKAEAICEAYKTYIAWKNNE